MDSKAYVIIDDQDQALRMEVNIDNILSTKVGFLKSFFFNPIDRDFWNSFEEQEIDIEKFVKFIKNSTKGYHIDLIACDYEYVGSMFNGMDVISQLRNEGFNCPIILYSGNEQKVVRDLLDSSSDTSAKIEKLTKLLKLQIQIFRQRDTYPEAVVEYLIKDYSLKDIILKKIKEYEDTTIMYDNGYYKGRKFGEVLEDISSEYKRGIDFLVNLVEYSIAYFSSFNKDE